MGIKQSEMIETLSASGKVLGMLAAGESWPGYSCGLGQQEYEEADHLIRTEFQHNQWFTEVNVRKSLAAWSAVLNTGQIADWLAPYGFPEESLSGKKVAVICAGNIPAVGLHDVLCVLLAGHHAMIKLSSDDRRLIPAILGIWSRFLPGLEERYSFVDQKMTGHEAVIATGSTNTSRYFEYYFGKHPHIIRKGRTSLAILDGSETKEELHLLGADIFDYFGLGCRSVSKLYLPEGFDLNRFFDAIYPYHGIIHHNKYANNYDYNKAVWLLNQEDLLENGFLILRKDTAIASPTASLYYEYYSDREVLMQDLLSRKDEIQCLSGHGFIPFGHTQKPELNDYADGVDTLAFLRSL